MLELVYFLSSNVARPVTYNSLAKTVEIKNASTIKNYLENLENTYLLFLVHKYDTSLKKQMFNAKKSYFIDLALIRELGFHVSADNGRLLENLVFIELKRRSKEVYYHRNKYECDFVIKEKTKIINAIQVSWTMEDKTTKEREINGLIEALKIYNLQEGLILTENEEKEIKIGSKKILIYPVWKWMLNL
jgi:predicted AAA+ superfamily ATPase